MAGLPISDWLPLCEAISLVADRCACAVPEARDALVRAGRESRIRARGTVPLNALRDPELAWQRAAARRDEDLEPGSWTLDIDWATDRIGRNFHVVIERSTLEAWLDPERTVPTSTSVVLSRESVRATLERRAASRDEENVWDIVCDASGAYEHDPQGLLADTLDAIVAGLLVARAQPHMLPENWRTALPLPFMAQLCREHAAPFPKSSDPGVFGFLRNLSVRADTFLGWLQERGFAPSSDRSDEGGQHAGASKASIRRSPGGKPTLRQAARDFIAKQYPDGVPANVKLAALVEDFKAKTGMSVSERTLRRALGRK